MPNFPPLSVKRLPKRLNYWSRRSRQKLQHKAEDLVRATFHHPDTQPVINKREVRVLGLRRSGNHAIINWIGQQVKGNSVFINHVRPLENPYRDQYESQLVLGRKLPQGDWKYHDIDWWKKEKEGKFSLKDCLIYSYEDQEIEKVAGASFERKHDLYLGRSKERFDVIVMRDPFNLVASRLKTKPREDGPNFDMLNVYSRRYSLLELWIAYAKECLGETSFLQHKKIFINYNKWFTDIDYRRHIAAQMNITFSDEGFNDVSISGRGSSFDGLKHAGEVHKMDVLNRWREFAENPTYRKLLMNTEDLLKYSNQLFGHIPGTEVLLDQPVGVF
ncbi:MAG: hypothetical protein ACFBSF_16420 [Leptolyngbyaceae cyanobacterium]